jgi:hypothetical protein
MNAANQTLFREHEPKSATLIIRVTQREKDYISDVAEKDGKSISRFLLDLVSRDLERRSKESETAKIEYPDYSPRKHRGNYTTQDDPPDRSGSKVCVSPMPRPRANIAPEDKYKEFAEVDSI